MANVQHNSLTGADLHDAGPVTVDLDLTDQAADPATPASGHHAAYTKAGGLYVKDDAGVVVGPLIDAASSVSLGTPALTLGTTNAAGSGSTAVGTGATIAAFDATVPVTQALGDAAAAGTAAVAARRDHKHGMPALSTATPLVESGSGAAGTGTLSSREDHVHPAGGGGSLTVEEADGTPTVTGVTTIKVSNGTLTDDGSGVVSITTGGGGSADVITLQSGAGSKRIPGWTQSPLIVPASPNAKDDEFDSTDTNNPPTGWTAMGTLTGVDINSTRKSHLYLKAAANGNYALAGIYKAWTPSAGDTVTAYLSDHSMVGQFQKAMLFVATATPGQVAGACTQVVGAGSGANMDEVNSKLYTSPSGGSLTNDFSTVGMPSPLYLRIVYASSTNLVIQASRGGNFWRTINSFNPAFTVGSYGLCVSPENTTGDVEALFDWIRFNWTP